MKIRKNNLLFLLLFSMFFNSDAKAIELEERNYFASIKAGKANVRSGPGKNYRIKFTYKMKYVPVRVISKYDNWNEIEDFEGERGWINRNLLSRKRTIMIKSLKDIINIYSAATKNSRILLKMENKTIAKLIGCKKGWCKVQSKGKKGWLEKSDIWGVKR